MFGVNSLVSQGTEAARSLLIAVVDVDAVVVVAGGHSELGNNGAS